MIQIQHYTLDELFRSAVAAYGPSRMCGMIDDEGYTFEQWGRHVLALRKFLLQSGVKPGDAVALHGENSPLWTMTYFAAVTAQAVAVPILNDFLGKEVCNILEHSEAKTLFVSKKYTDKISEWAKDDSSQVFILEEIPELIQDIPLGSTAEESEALPRADRNDLASIIYTSGTTGMSKGVMLSHGNIMSNGEVSSRTFIELKPGERMLSILPLSHAYEFTIGLILGMITGLDTYYLGKPPMASILLPALEQVRPSIMLSVPLLIEKVYRSSVKQQVSKKALLRWLYRFGFGRRFIHRKAGKKLYQRFGSNLRFFGIGGAPLDPTVEQFLREAKFPYAIGYGLTETAPLIAGCAPSWTRLKSTGKVLEGVEMRIADPHPKTGEGEIQVKGPNVMLGYYKNEEATREAFTEDGWFRTGDLGIFDKDGFLFIKGRLKSVILGANGENIYPEGIEAVINSYDFVEESIVLPSPEGLVARVKIDLDAMAEHIKVGADQAQAYAREYAESLVSRVNKELNVNSRVRKMKLLMDPLIRTPTKKIKRFLYHDSDDESDQQNSNNQRNT